MNIIKREILVSNEHKKNRERERDILLLLGACGWFACFVRVYNCSRIYRYIYIYRGHVLSHTELTQPYIHLVCGLVSYMFKSSKSKTRSIKIHTYESSRCLNWRAQIPKTTTTTTTRRATSYFLFFFQQPISLCGT